MKTGFSVKDADGKCVWVSNKALVNQQMLNYVHVGIP